jgi:hypothetical protein
MGTSGRSSHCRRLAPDGIARVATGLQTELQNDQEVVYLAKIPKDTLLDNRPKTTEIQQFLV